MGCGKSKEQESREPVGCPDSAATPTKAATTVEAENLKAENGDLKDRLLRALAECENVRRRGEHLVLDARRSAIAEFAREMLTVAGEEARLADDLAAGDVEIDAMNLFLDSRSPAIFGGSNEIQRNILAKAVLRLPG